MIWRVHLLGGFRVERGARAVTRLESRAIVALLARLALFPHRAHPREELAALLWPESDREQGLARLRHALSALRRSLATGGELSDDATGSDDTVFVADRRLVHVRADRLWCDAVALEMAVCARKFDDARALQNGELLPGFYDEWICDERNRLLALTESIPDSPPDAAPEAMRETIETRPVRTRAHATLPRYLTDFFGRDDERAQLLALLSRRRLVTLLGPGGIGKTRLAIETARAHADSPEADSPETVIAFVPIADCSDAARIPERIRSALGLSGETDTLSQLRDFFWGRQSLLILDNLEQVVDSGAADVVETLLLQIPELRCLVTSRQPLGVSGEQSFPVGPLLPAASNAFFVDRARAARPDFPTSGRHAGEIAGLCARLEGIPLALELAGALVRQVRLSDLSARLADAPHRLARPGKLTRHASLHAAIGSSWHLLSVHQQRFLAILSVPDGSFTADLAREISGLDDAEQRLFALADASLIVLETRSPGPDRYRFLEMIRAFCREQLPETDRAQATIRLRAFFSRGGTGDDLSGIQTALAGAIADADASTAYRIFLRHAGGPLAALRSETALSLAKDTLALPAPTSRDRLLALSHAIAFAGNLGARTDARAFVDEARATANAESGGPRADEALGIALSLAGQHAIAESEPPETILATLTEALACATRADDASTRATVLRRLGVAHMKANRLDDASAAFTNSGALFSRLGDDTGARYANANLAHVLSLRGDNERALDLYRACLDDARVSGDLWHQTKILVNLGSIQSALGLWNESLASDRECLALCRAIGNLRTMAFAFWNLPETLLELGDPQAAASLMDFAARFWEERFGPLSETDRADADRILARSNAVPEILALPEALAIALA